MWITNDEHCCHKWRYRFAYFNLVLSHIKHLQPVFYQWQITQSLRYDSYKIGRKWILWKNAFLHIHLPAASQLHSRKTTDQLPAPEKLKRIIQAKCTLDCATLRCVFRKNGLHCYNLYRPCQKKECETKVHLIPYLKMRNSPIAVTVTLNSNLKQFI